MHAESALSEETKLSNLSEEVHRRLRNTSIDAAQSKRVDIFRKGLY